MSYRSCFLAGAAALALSAGSALAQNAAKTFQFGAVNDSTTTQDGATGNNAVLGQLGLVNRGSALQGTARPGANNTNTMVQVGVANSASATQFGTVSNMNTINQLSFGGINSALVGQAALGMNHSHVDQIWVPSAP